MRIGFDFDKVFVNYPPLVPPKLIDYLYKGKLAVLKEKTKNVELSYRYPGTFEQNIRILSHLPLFRKPLKKNITALKKICKEKNCNTYLVSSRFGFLRKRTNEWIKNNHLNKYFKGVYFNYHDEQPHLFKEKTIAKLKLDTYVDDDIDLLVYLSKKNQKLSLFWVTQKKESEYKMLPKSIVAIKDINELYTKYLKN